MVQGKNLIIHIDDAGMGYAANGAAQDLLLKGIARSASVMVPCPWAFDFIRWCKANPGFDVGIHLTHTCEWDAGRWRPLSGRSEAPSLYDGDGFLWRGFGEEMLSVAPDEYTKEARAQIEQALQWGLQPTHFDNHMWTARKTPVLFKSFLDLSKQYGVIPHVPEWIFFNEEMKRVFRESGFTSVCMAVESGRNDLGYEVKKADFRRLLTEMKDGLYVLTLHPVIETDEIKAMIPAWEERYMEYRLLMEDETERIIRELGIRITTWREVAAGLI